MDERSVLDVRRSSMETEELDIRDDPGIMSLPLEILVHVFSYVTNFRDLCRIAKVCRKFHRLTVEYDHILWKTCYDFKPYFAGVKVQDGPWILFGPKGPNRWKDLCRQFTQAAIQYGITMKAIFTDGPDRSGVVDTRIGEATFRLFSPTIYIQRTIR
eukprot:TRINITY_DN2435_c0_g1_i1.p1 TRINITY_DN2435_c0_g1~~TRINITY_DN2435_c0_g1_i1.p1  ORF type:complete len:157 (-),score=4.95 TRINITY_DN2435_c0_g1_i1:146-616(-)